MLIDVLRSTRLLERLTIFSGTEDDVPGVPGTPEYLFLSVLKSLRAGALGTAKAQYNELAAVLSVPLDNQQLEPLRTILHLKLWDGSSEDKQQLQNFLIKELHLKFEADMLPSVPAQPTPLTGTGNEQATSQPSNTPQLPTHITPDLYSTTAFLKLLHPDNVPSNEPLSAQFDPSRLSEVIADASIPIQQRAVLLQQSRVPPAVLSVEVLTRVVREWLAADAERGWNCKDAFEWVTNGWNGVTAEQAGALRAILPGPSFGSNPPVDRPYIVALVNKALAGPAAAAAAASGPGIAEPAPWACGAANAAAAADLARILEVCDQLGPAADWVRLHAVHAQLLLQQRQQPAVDISLYITYMKMLGRATWSPGPTVTDNRFGTQPQQQPMHVPCSVCGMRPITGPRFRSLSLFGFNTCAGCVRSQQAAAAAPMEEVRVDDSIYMSPELPLPPVLGVVSQNESERESEARKMLLELVQADGVAGTPEQFTPDGQCPLAAAGLLLPREWRNKAVAEGKLLSGRGNKAAWSRLYQECKGKVEQLRQVSELAFAMHNKESYTSKEEVVLELTTKNNGQQGVLVKLYEINCWNYYTIERKAVDLNLELSGLTPTKTIHINTPEDPIIRCHHSIPLGLSGRAGVWLAEVVAGGTRVRARIYKGTLRLVQRPSVAGQVITIVDEDWRQVKGVRIWCDNQEYKNKPDGKPNEVLLPYSRDMRSTPLVVAATVTDQVEEEAGALGGGAMAGTSPDVDHSTECVTLFESFRRLKEEYSLHGQLYCHPESLLPGQPVPLLLQLSLQLHGRLAPLKLLQEVTLRLTASTQEGAEVTQVFKDLTVDPATGELKLQYNLPPAARQLSAVLTARILLTLPGTNGEPAYQDFDLNQLLRGGSEATASISINASAATSSIWDVYLSIQASNGGSDEPEYVLQVLGRAGEAPAVPKVLSVWMTHVHYSAQQQVHVRVQTGPGGTVPLGPLTGVRHIEAQLEGRLDCMEGFAATAPVAPGRSGSAGRAAAGAGSMRKWQIARTSWWQSRLQPEYTIAAGSDLEIPLTTALGQTLDPKLLQLLPQGKSSSNTSLFDCQFVVADISAKHLSVIPANAAAGAAGSSSSAASAGAMLGSSGTAVLKVRGLAPGRYRLLVPALMLESPISQIFHGFEDFGKLSNTGAIHIRVLPAIQAAAAAQDQPAAAAAADGVSGSSTQQTAEGPTWLWAGGSQSNVPAVITQPSAVSQLNITSLSCTTTSGLSVQLIGTPDQLESARIVAVFGRNLSDGSGVSADMLHDTVPSGYDIMGQSPQSCGGFGLCDYSNAAKLDSAVAYVLQRRQWEAEGRRGGGIRPGNLLDRPSLLVVPVCKKSAASGTSVLRGGDGQLVQAKKKQTREYHPQPPLFGAAGFAGSASTVAYGVPGAGRGFGELESGFTHSYPSAQSPVLSFLLNPGVVLTDLEMDIDTGLVNLSAQDLQRLLTAAIGTQNAAPGSSRAGVAGISSYTHVYVAAYVPDQRGQFSSARCVVQGAASAKEMAQPSSRRDLGLMRTVQEDDILALSCDVLALQPGASLTLPSDPAAAEAAVYSTPQQFYQLLAGLLEISEAAWGPPSYNGGYRGVARRGLAAGALQSAVGDTRAVKKLLPRPYAPPNAGGSNCSDLLRQWEPLLLQWRHLSGPDRLDQLDKLNSTEAAFYLACRDTQAYQQLILPLLKTKQPSELTCLEQILLLQATYDQPPIPTPTATTTTTATEDHEPTAAYKSAKRQLLQHWYAPHRYQRLTALEQVMLAALDGPEALLVLSRDMRASLKTPEERRGVKRTWMSPDRRALFDFALLLSKQLEQQQGQEQQQAQQTEEDGDDFLTLSAGGAEGFDSLAESDDYVHVDYADLQQQQQQQPMVCGVAAGGAFALPAPPAPAMGVPKPQMLMKARAAADESDLAARASVAAAAMRSARLAPKETQEWAEAGWWKWDGQQTPPELIPVSHFWADFAEHLATNPDQPFIPTDPTGTAASTAAIVAALAVIGQTPGAGLGATTTTAAAAADSSSIGCSKVNNGSTVTLTATSPCLLWIKQAKSVASIAAAAAAGSSGLVPPIAQQAVTAGPAGAVIVQGGTSSVLVTERLYDPRFASTTDPETGEQLLLALLPNEQQPLLAGQSYRQSVIITSIGAAEQHLDILVQIPQGALPLSDTPSTVSVSITLAPYATHTLNMTFYFPHGGVYKRAPASVTKRGRPAWLPASSPSPVYVVDRPGPTALSTQQQQVTGLFDWAKFLKTASRKEILEYLSTGDLSVARLGDLSPYCKDHAFFIAATTALSKRHTYNSDVWKWAVTHMDGTTLQQMLPMSGLAEKAFGRQLPVSHLPLMQMSGHDVGVWQLEYWPWVNPYCRPIPRVDGGDSNLPSVLTDNPSIAEQWRRFLLASLFDFSSVAIGSSHISKGLSLAQATSAAVYLLLQDRVDEAEELLRQFDLEAAAAALEDGAPLRMQVDYLRAWMALCRPVSAAAELSTSVASALALGKCVVERYKMCASQAWRKRFTQLNILVKELEQQQAAGGAAAATEGPDVAPEDTAAMLSIISCEAGQLKFQHRGLSSLCLSAYQIDTELLFTTQPFSSLSSRNNLDASSKSRGIRRDGDDASTLGLGKVAYVRPSARKMLSLMDDGASTAADRVEEDPDPTVAMTAVYDVDMMFPELKSQSVLLELSGGGISRTVPRFGSRLVVHIIESQGILQACYTAESGTSSSGHVLLPAAATYVKVFARDRSGDEWFYKDGYTDLRGKFDYITLTSTADMSRVSRFSLLVASPELGAVMQQAAPLPR